MLFLKILFYDGKGGGTHFKCCPHYVFLVLHVVYTPYFSWPVCHGVWLVLIILTWFGFSKLNQDCLWWDFFCILYEMVLNVQFRHGNLECNMIHLTHICWNVHAINHVWQDGIHKFIHNVHDQDGSPLQAISSTTFCQIKISEHLKLLLNVTAKYLDVVMLSLVKIMAWCLTGTKPLSKPVMTQPVMTQSWSPF